MGKGFNTVEKTLQYFSFTVENSSDSPVVIIERENETLKVTPQEVCSLILKKVKQDVETKLGHTVNKAVITVPAYFNTTQREVTLTAANEAGFTVLKLFNEPTAAALSYYFKNDDESDCYSLVYDLGGGTFDVSILKKTSSNIDIICVDGDTQIGGKDFDNLIIDYVCEHLKKEYNYDAKQNRRDMRRLQNTCEAAKVELSTLEETSVILHGFVPDNRVVEVELTRKDFELKASTLIKRTINIVDRCLKSSEISKNEIRDVILAGGSSRIPRIQEELSRYFGGKILNRFVHLDECVAEGAALQAAMLANNPKQEIRKLIMTDVVPLSLGTKEWYGKMIFIIKKGTSIPTKNSVTVFNAFDQQKKDSFEVFECEHLNAKKNRYLGLLTLENITPAPPNERKLCYFCY